MKVYLLSAGNAPRDALSTILSAHACGAAPAVSGFEILHLSPNTSGIRDLEGFAGDLSLCGSAFAGEDAFPLAGFSCRVRLGAIRPRRCILTVRIMRGMSFSVKTTCTATPTTVSTVSRYVPLFQGSESKNCRYKKCVKEISRIFCF